MKQSAILKIFLALLAVFAMLSAQMSLAEPWPVKRDGVYLMGAIDCFYADGSLVYRLTTGDGSLVTLGAEGAFNSGTEYCLRKASENGAAVTLRAVMRPQGSNVQVYEETVDCLDMGPAGGGSGYTGRPPSYMRNNNMSRTGSGGYVPGYAPQPDGAPTYAQPDNSPPPPGQAPPPNYVQPYAPQGQGY